MLTFSTGGPGRPPPSAAWWWTGAPSGPSGWRWSKPASFPTVSSIAAWPIPPGGSCWARSPGASIWCTVLDQNNDRRLQARESFDTVRVTAGRDSVGALGLSP